MRTVLILLMLCLASAGTFAQEVSEPPETTLAFDPDDLEAGDEEQSEYTSYPMAAAEAREQTRPVEASRQAEPIGRSEYELGLTYAVLAFAALALFSVAYLAAKAAKPWAPDSIIRVFGIVLIVPLAVLLVVAGYSEKQIAPVIGLLGVIAGYLLGHNQRPPGGG